MGGASKLLSSLLLTSSPLRLHPSAAAFALLLSSPSPLRTFSTAAAAAAASSLPYGSSSSSVSSTPPPYARFPEWSRLIDRLAAAGYAARAPFPADELAVAPGCGLSAEAEAAVSSCLAFARDRPDLLRSLPRKDLQAVVANVAPALFKDGEASAQRLQQYLSGEENNVIQSVGAESRRVTAEAQPSTMPSIAGGGGSSLFRVARGMTWLRCCRRYQQRPLFSSLAGGRGDAPHLPVVIVGGGPVGLVLSFLLTKFGIKCNVIEKSMEFTRHPRAHFINNRTMEIFRKLDGLAGDIEKSQPPVDLWRKFVYCTSLSGSILGSVDHMKQEDFAKVISPISVAHFSQYKLVDLLLKKLEGIGFQTCFPDELCGSSTQDLVLENKILMGHECSSIQLTDDGILVGASFNNGGRMQERKFHCGFLLGADGARSTVRKLAGISMKGERDLQKLVSVHFRSRDLGKYLSSDRPGMLFFIFNPDAIGVLVAHDVEHGEFVLQIPFYPPQQMFEDFSTKVCEQIIVKLVGWEPADVQVLDIKPWVMHAEVAEKYIGYNSRVVLVGDAAHRFPPAGGFGMNTGVQDAHNLAWKLCLLLNGIAAPSIIQTYESERRPVAIFNTELSVENFKAAMSIPATLGLDPTVANSVHRVINSSLGSVIPRNLQKTVLEGLFSIGRAQVSDYILNEKNPLGSLRLARLRSILDEGKSLQLQFPAEDLGFRYDKGALVAEDHAETIQQAETLKHSKRSSREYIPSAKVGSRLPHMLVRQLSDSNEDVFSTMDLVSRDKLEFVLIIAPLRESYELARTMLKISDELKVSAKVCVIWPQGSVDAKVKGSSPELAPWTNHVDVEEIPRASANSWWEMCQITRKSVILVRPDEHIAWRTESDMVRDVDSEVRRVFSQILCLNRHQV